MPTAPPVLYPFSAHARRSPMGAHQPAPVICACGDYLPQLWLFWVAPVIGGVIGALVCRGLLGEAENIADA